MKPFTLFIINPAHKKSTSKVKCKQLHQEGTVEIQHWNQVNFVNKITVPDTLSIMILSVYAKLKHIRLELILKIFLCTFLNLVANSAHAKSFE